MNDNQELHILGQSIAIALGSEWRYADGQPLHRALLDGPDGIGISIGYKDFHGNRLTIYGRWPEPIRYRERTYQFYPRERPIISVAANRVPGSIAKDIQRRLLPEYLELWQKAVEHKESKRIEFEKLDEMLARLIRIQGVQEHKNKIGVWFGKYNAGHGDASIYSDETVDLNIHNLPLETACEILERMLQ